VSRPSRGCARRGFLVGPSLPLVSVRSAVLPGVQGSEVSPARSVRDLPRASAHPAQLPQSRRTLQWSRHAAIPNPALRASDQLERGRHAGCFSLLLDVPSVTAAGAPRRSGHKRAACGSLKGRWGDAATARIGHFKPLNRENAFQPNTNQLRRQRRSTLGPSAALASSSRLAEGTGAHLSGFVPGRPREVRPPVFNNAEAESHLSQICSIARRASGVSLSISSRAHARHRAGAGDRARKASAASAHQHGLCVSGPPPPT
jgi:hypothetical protein